MSQLSDLVVDNVGEAVAVFFPGEEDGAVFLVGSAEVVICSRTEWMAARALPTPVTLEPELPQAAPAVAGTELQRLLRKLGVSIS